jgi:hypothetical protein
MLRSLANAFTSISKPLTGGTLPSRRSAALAWSLGVNSMQRMVAALTGGLSGAFDAVSEERGL